MHPLYTDLKIEHLKQQIELIELTIKLIRILNKIKTELCIKKGPRRLNHVYDLEELEQFERLDDSGNKTS